MKLFQAMSFQYSIEYWGFNKYNTYIRAELKSSINFKTVIIKRIIHANKNNEYQYQSQQVKNDSLEDL